MISFTSIRQILIGDNNFRHANENPKEYLKLIEKLLEEFSNVERCHLVLTSILPSPETNHKCKHLFKYVSDSVKKLSQNYGSKSSFLNLTKVFMHGGRIKQNLYADGVHLNEEGAQILATRIFNHLKYIPKL